MAIVLANRCCLSDHPPYALSVLLPEKKNVVQPKFVSAIKFRFEMGWSHCWKVGGHTLTLRFLANAFVLYS